VTNHLAQDHALQFLNAGAANAHTGTGVIKPAQTKTLTFKAPAEGAYLYCDPGTDPDDPTADPVQRVLALYGALLVVNPDSPWRDGAHGPEFERQWFWILHNIDPVWAGTASRNGTVDPDKTPLQPRYFTLNARRHVSRRPGGPHVRCRPRPGGCHAAARALPQPGGLQLAPAA
jgi:hypothetical protein